jgi:hypothetical protein
MCVVTFCPVPTISRRGIDEPPSPLLPLLRTSVLSLGEPCLTSATVRSNHTAFARRFCAIWETRLFPIGASLRNPVELPASVPATARQNPPDGQWHVSCYSIGP